MMPEPLYYFDANTGERAEYTPEMYAQAALDRAIVVSSSPASCSKLGLVRALREIGRWTDLKAAIAADPDVQEEWDLAIEIRRSDPLVQRMTSLFTLTEGETDALFIRAAELVA